MLRISKLHVLERRCIVGQYFENTTVNITRFHSINWCLPVTPIRQYRSGNNLPNPGIHGKEKALTFGIELWHSNTNWKYRRTQKMKFISWTMLRRWIQLWNVSDVWTSNFRALRMQTTNYSDRGFQQWLLIYTWAMITR